MALFSCVVMGNESLLIQCADKLRARGHQINAVVTDAPAVMDWASQAGLQIIAPGAGLDHRLQRIGFDWLFSIANLRLISEAVITLAKQGAVNFHDGPLPRHAGLNAPVWAQIEGETTHGVSWHMIEPGIDTGAVLASEAFEIGPQDTALTLNTKSYEAGINSFAQVIAQLEAGAPNPVVQDPALRTYHARADRPEAGGILDLTHPASELERLVRALDHGPYWNPLCVPKLAVGGAIWAVQNARVVTTTAAPGTVLEVDTDSVTVACGDGGLQLSGLRGLDGAAVDVSAAVQVGDVLQPDIDRAALTQTTRAVAAHDDWWHQRLADLAPLSIGAGACSGITETLPLAETDTARALAWAARLAEDEGQDIAIVTPEVAALTQTGLVAGWLPLAPDLSGTLADLSQRATDALQVLADKQGFAHDIVLRDTELTVTLPQIALSFGQGAVPGVAVTVELGLHAKLHYDTAALSETQARILANRLDALCPLDAATPIADLPALSEIERQMVLFDWNQTARPVTGPQTLHAAFEAQVAKAPNDTALIYEDITLSYDDLNARANRVAHVLQQRGVTLDTVVGLFCNRSPDMLIAALGILKAGGAYLPLDPGYPADRLQHYMQDSGARLLITQSSLVASVPSSHAQVLVIDEDPDLAAAPTTNPHSPAGAGDLAYMIYTSGSTGTPKGVMVEHGNVLNFFAGMDDTIRAEGGTWLAVTSLSFDISVLELFWTTARGFRVVLTSEADRNLISNGPVPGGAGNMAFSLYYWGNDDGVGRDKYRLLLEGAQFADQNGFCAVWTPERHFHAFGGPYPNPSVTGAAVAAVTRNIAVRAGSVVAPLHHPARIAEEWAVIDNLTNGRAGLAVASGWQPDDFVLRPENTPPDNKPALTRAVDQIRKLWAGEGVPFPRADGTEHAVITQPRPVSRDLPIWMTIAGNPDTWREAGRLGCHVLTHLLGQSIEDVADKIQLYHAALRENGHDPQDFTVTLMLHTCLAETRDAARERAREPMKAYLRSAAGLIKQYAWAFPAFKRPKGVSNAFELDLGVLEDDELDQILDFAFERYFNDSGLFGTVEDALARTEQLKQIGVGEIACLIDYGIPVEDVLEGMKPLAQVVSRANQDIALDPQDFSIAAQILRHEVTHLQCTPSMARMFVANDEARTALARVQHLFLGGEALPGALVQDLKAATQARITNMYGPTETTIWSSTHVAGANAQTVSIGGPLVNQQMYVLTPDGQPCAVGQQGELWIGGAGVTRGYWNRPDLTAERFVDNPFHPGRMYRTGDQVKWRADGALEYLGRGDGQVKLRGYRIELGEIDAALEALPMVSQAVTLVREDMPGDPRLVAYVTSPETLTEPELRAAVSRRLPPHMVPQRFVQLAQIPLTPNLKIDRNALPEPLAPVVVAKRVAEPAARPVAAQAGPADSATQDAIAAIWKDVLGVVPSAGSDNFFDLGGHSLLAVQAHRAMRDRFGVSKLSITDVFRFPTLQGIAGRVVALSDGEAPRPTPEPAPKAPDNARALSRSEAMSRRRAMRARRSA